MKEDLDKLHIDDSDCLEAMDHLYAYLSGELDNNATKSKIEHHLSHCKSCFSRTEMERELNKRLKESNKDETPDSLKNRLRHIMEEL
ncbi:MAG: zf-HC2 domain-containing protein [Gammaproteobacteria bacterium]|jgi:anti-sigma factor (TIGR02949 family)